MRGYSFFFFFRESSGPPKRHYCGIAPNKTNIDVEGRRCGTVLPSFRTQSHLRLPQRTPRRHELEQAFSTKRLLQRALGLEPKD